MVIEKKYPYRKIHAKSYSKAKTMVIEKKYPSRVTVEYQ